MSATIRLNAICCMDMHGTLLAWTTSSSFDTISPLLGCRWSQTNVNELKRVSNNLKSSKRCTEESVNKYYYELIDINHILCLCTNSVRCSLVPAAADVRPCPTRRPLRNGAQTWQESISRHISTYHIHVCQYIILTKKRINKHTY